MLRKIRLVVAVAVFLGAPPVLAKPVTIKGRIVRYGVEQTPIVDANVKLFDVCSSGDGDDDNRNDLSGKRVTTDKDGRYQIDINVDWRPVCIFADAAAYMGNQKTIALANSEVDAGDLILKPLRAGIVNFKALTDFYSSAPRNVYTEERFVDIVAKAVVAMQENKQSAGRRYVADRKFRFLITAGCQKNQAVCQPIARDIEEWSLVAKKTGGVEKF